MNRSKTPSKLRTPVHYYLNLKIGVRVKNFQITRSLGPTHKIFIRFRRKNYAPGTLLAKCTYFQSILVLCNRLNADIEHTDFQFNSMNKV